MIPQPNQVYKCYWYAENPVEDDIYYVNIVTDIKGNTVYGHCIDTNSTNYFDEVTNPAEVLEWTLDIWNNDKDGTFILLGTTDDFPEWFI